MNKATKIILILLSVIILIISSLFFYYFLVTKDVYLDKNKLTDIQHNITFYDKNDKEICNKNEGKIIAQSDEISDVTKNAFIAIEDKRFLSHKGVDYKGLLRAIKNNIMSFSFKEGGSTISQQLIKNTHLSSEKTLKRKLAEIKLAKKLEKEFTKDEIITKYLNTIYFGENCFGIAKATKHYFNKSPKELTVNESCALAGLVKAPSSYSPSTNMEKFNERKNLVLLKMLEQNFITQEDYDKNVTNDVKVNTSEKSQKYDFFNLCNKELSKIMENNPYENKQLKVYTSFDKEEQNVLETTLNEKGDYENSGILMNKNGFVSAFYSASPIKNRQLGSSIKPILVYAPAIENDIVSIMTPINDEKTDFNGYSPCNYGDKYYGYIPVKKSLAISSNVCAIKLLNMTGIEKSKKYASDCGINLTDNDNNLALALGSTEKGASLIDLTASYSVFNNDGYYFSPCTILKVLNENNKIIYENNISGKKVFDDDTICLMNEMMKYVVTDGTAKKLSCLDYTVYGKTGTVGNKKGNTDAYCISYTSDKILGVWYGNKDKELMKNNITGGSVPCDNSRIIWNSICKNKVVKDIKRSDKVKEIYLDKISYEKDHEELLADDITPKKYLISTIEKTKNIINYKKSNRFSYPKIKMPIISIDTKGINIQLCQTEFIFLKIYRVENDSKTLIFDDLVNKDMIINDSDLRKDKLYKYMFIPYTKIDNTCYYGEKLFSENIKINQNVLSDDWWINE